MTPTVEQVYDRVAMLLGDPRKVRFKDTDMEEPFASAYEELFDYLLECQLPVIELQTTYHLASGTASLTPETIGISNFGELVRLEERPWGTTDDYDDVDAVSELPQSDPASTLGCYKWRGDTFYFIAPTADIDLRVTYHGSGQAPTTGTTGIDGALNYLAYRTAAILGPTKGFSESKAKTYDIEARGVRLDGRGGAAHRLIQPMVRALQKTPLQLPAYSASGGFSHGGRRPVYTTD